MIYTTLSAIVFALVVILNGIGTFGQDQWWIGLGAGVATAIAWYFDRRVGLMLGVVGLGLLVMAMGGLANDLPEPSRALFNGMAVGLTLGIAGCVALRWRHIKPHLVELARVEGVEWLTRLLTRSTKR